MTESIIGFILLVFAVFIVKFGQSGLQITAWGLLALIGIAVGVTVLDQRKRSVR